MSYLALVERTQREFYPGIVNSHQARLQRAYDPAIERARILSTPETTPLRAEIRRNLITVLAERLHVRSTSNYFDFVDGQLRPDLFPNEPFVDVLQRGFIYRQSLGSSDQEREAAEVDGWALISQKMSDPDTPIGTTIVSLSPPSKSPGSPYKENFVDQFTLIEEAGQRRVRRERHSVNFCPEDYEVFALESDAKYFDNYQDKPVDAWFLSHPFVSQQQVLEQRKVGLSPADFEKIVQRCLPFAQAHLDSLFAANLDLDRVALTWAAFLNKADLGDRVLATQPLFTSLASEINHLGRLPVRDVVGGCGSTGGIMVANSVASFGRHERWSYHFGTCRPRPGGCGAVGVEVGPCNICRGCMRTKYGGA